MSWHIMDQKGLLTDWGIQAKAELPYITVILCDCWQNYRWRMLEPERLLEIVWPKSFIFQRAKPRPREGEVFYSTSYSELMIVGTRTQVSWFSVQSFQRAQTQTFVFKLSPHSPLYLNDENSGTRSMKILNSPNKEKKPWIECSWGQ